ncbi:TPA: hypothetical protein L7V50_000149 [Klebsiella quasipneumoniae subsp. similipneumoniae]|nr:hypothetical protein [Klebsiella quasipneumoniae subsp. similipneumoniae]
MSKPSRLQRKQIKTKLIICEGISDKKFIERFKFLTHSRDNGFTVKIDQSSGGGPKTAIIHAINYAGQFDQKCVFIDSDITIPKDAFAAAKRRGIQIIQSTPHCIEGFLLKLTGYNKEIHNTEHAKQIFYEKYSLPQVITQKWVDEYIDIVLIQLIINKDNHCCKQIITSLKKFFSEWP